MRNFVPEENLPSPEQAFSLLVDNIPPKIKVTNVDILDAVGKITASPVFARIDYPPFSRSTVDGYALKSSSTPGKLKVVDKISIGEWKDLRIKGDEAVEVDTGSPIPLGADAVIKIEETKREGQYLVLDRKVRFGANVAWVGSDIAQETEILGKFHEILPEDIGTLASLGIRSIDVVEPPSVYIIATGDELIQPGDKLVPGKIYESNIHFLASRLKQLKCKIAGMELLPDDKEKISLSLRRAVETADIVITTGGTSAGEKDYVHQAIREMGKIVIQGINTKPGKPTILGEIKGKPVFGLSGNIVATIMIFDQLVARYVEKASGKSDVKRYSFHDRVKATAILPIQADKYRTTNIPVYLLRDQRGFFAVPVPFDSYMVGTFSSSDGYVTLSPGTLINEGDMVEVFVKSIDKRPLILGEEHPALRGLDLRKILLGTVPACAALKYNVGDVLIVSDLLCNKVEDSLEIKRWILESGEGDNIGYHEWIGMSKLVSDPAVKLKSPSTAKLFLGKGKVIAPEGYIQGTRLTQETLRVVIRNKDLQFLQGIFSENT